MSNSHHIIFFHAPQSRSTGTRILLEELGADYELKPLNFKANEQRGARYLAVNPMGKVPAILHNDALITEQAAVHIYLADLFPEAGLAPALIHQVCNRPHFVKVREQDAAMSASQN
jgi:glutathione S-transferase